jgi:hypothetical protein
MAEEAEALEKGMRQANQLPPLPVDSWEWEEKSGDWEEEKDASIATADMMYDSSSVEEE